MAGTFNMLICMFIFISTLLGKLTFRKLNFVPDANCNKYDKFQFGQCITGTCTGNTCNLCEILLYRRFPWVPTVTLLIKDKNCRHFKFIKILPGILH